VDTVVAYNSPADVCPETEASVIFKAGTIKNDRLYACTQTELLTYSVPDFALVDYVTLPHFNDVHHVMPTDRGTLLTAVTGLDMVLELEPSGTVVREWDVLGEQPWRRFSRTVDYRKVPTTKPHLAHPNYVFLLGEDVWVTRFVQRDAVCLGNPDKRIEIGIEGPHDGVLYGQEIYFTTVDGHVVVADASTGRTRRVWDLRKLETTARLLGWCRGLKVLGPDRVIVGFSRLRPTRFVENVGWAKRQARSWLTGDDRHSIAPPTRLWGVDLAKGEIFWELDLERRGMDALFSIH